MYSQLLIAFPSRRGHLRLAGSLDPADHAQLRRRLDDARAAGCLHLELDCSEVTDIDAMVVTDLCAAKAELEQRGGALSLKAPSPVVRRAIEHVGRADLLVAIGTERQPDPVDLTAMLDKPARLDPGARRRRGTAGARRRSAWRRD